MIHASIQAVNYKDSASFSDKEFTEWWSYEHKRIVEIWEAGEQTEGLNKLCQLEVICNEQKRYQQWVETLKSISGLYYRKKNYNEAIKYIRKALKIANQMHWHKEIVQCYSIIALILYGLGLDDEFYRYNQKSLELAYKIDLKDEIIRCLCNAAHAYTVNRKHEEAVKLLKEALEMNNQLSKKSAFYAELLIELSRNYKFLEKYDLAIENLQSILEETIYEDVKIHKSRQASIVVVTINEIASCYFLKGEYDLALENISKALAYANKHQVGGSTLFYCYEGMGKICYHKAKFKDAIDYLRKALPLKLTSTHGKKDVYEYLTKAYVKIGDVENTIAIIDEQKAYNDSHSNKMKEYQVQKYQYLQENERIKLELVHKEELMDKINELNTSLQRFTKMAVHDLKEPLRTMKAFSSLLTSQSDDTDETTKRMYLKFINTSATIAERLLADMYQYSKVGFEKILIEKINCNDLLEKVLIQLSNQIKRQEAQVILEELPTIYSAKSLLIQLFQNLISNAIKFRAKNRKPIVKISAQLIDGGHEFLVEDNGIGVSDDKKEAIFEAFTKLNLQSEYEGSGLGLATCKKIVDNLKGSISIESELGKGTTFKITLKDGKEELLLLDD